MRNAYDAVCRKTLRKGFLYRSKHRENDIIKMALIRSG
jgi:hypothetical protein